MGLSLRELGEKFSAREISYWQLYEEIEPFGSRLLDEHFARLELAHSSEKARIENLRLMASNPKQMTAEEMARVLSSTVR